MTSGRLWESTNVASLSTRRGYVVRRGQTVHRLTPSVRFADHLVVVRPHMCSHPYRVDSRWTDHDGDGIWQRSFVHSGIEIAFLDGVFIRGVFSA